MFIAGSDGTLCRIVSVGETKIAKDVQPPLRRANGAPVAGRQTLRGLRAISEALFATAQSPPPSTRLDWLDGEIEDFLARRARTVRWSFALLVFVVSVLAPVLVGRFCRLHRLHLPERIAALTAMERRFGEPLIGLKALLCVLYYEHADSRREIGVP